MNFISLIFIISHLDPFIMYFLNIFYCFHLCCFWSSFYCQLQDKIEVREGSWFEPLKDIEGKLAGLVSNPPYIPSKDISGLQAEVGRHEPRVALDGGIDGMDALLHLCDGAALFLKPGGFFAFEVLIFCSSGICTNYFLFLIVLLLIHET